MVRRPITARQKTSQELGGLPYYVVDTSKLDEVKTFAQKLIKEHPEIDAVVANAGVQLPLDVNKLNLEDVDAELRTNAHSPVHLATHLLDHFKAKPAARIFYVSSVLGFVPSSILNPVYNGESSSAPASLFCDVRDVADALRALDVTTQAPRHSSTFGQSLSGCS